MVNEKSYAKRAAFLGICLSLSLILGYVENLIPVSFAVPGIKLGLSNLCVVIALMTFGYADAFILDILKVILSGMLFGNMSMMLYGLCGALLSYLFMAAFKASNRFSAVGISIIGGVMHNIGQLILAIIITSTAGLIFYAPYLIIAGAITGGILGMITRIVMRYIKNTSI